MKITNDGRQRRGVLAFTGSRIGMFVLGCVAAAALAGWLMGRADATTTGSEQAVDLALVDTLNAVLTNSACPKDLSDIQAVAEGLFPMMHPEIAQFDQPQDEAALDAEAARNWSLENPGDEHARRMADPAYRDQVASELAGLQFGVILEP